MYPASTFDGVAPSAIAKVAARSEREPQVAPLSLRQRRDERHQILHAEETALDGGFRDRVACQRDIHGKIGIAVGEGTLAQRIMDEAQEEDTCAVERHLRVEDAMRRDPKLMALLDTYLASTKAADQGKAAQAIGQYVTSNALEIPLARLTYYVGYNQKKIKGVSFTTGNVYPQYFGISPK